jgi:hypothetical protein
LFPSELFCICHARSKTATGAGRANDAIHQVIQRELGSKQSFVVRMGRPVIAVSVWIFIVGANGAVTREKENFVTVAR